MKTNIATSTDQTSGQPNLDQSIAPSSNASDNRSAFPSHGIDRIDRLDRIDPLATDRHGSHNGSDNGSLPDRIDRIKTGYRSDNFSPKTEANDLPINHMESTSAESEDENSHPSGMPLNLIRQLIPTSLRKRKFRADSFMAKLTLPQRALVLTWLQQETIETVRAKVAAAPPEGFGIDVHPSALKRLRNFTSNTELNYWIENAMDATYDILAADTSVDTAPLREALSLLLHSRIMTYTREQANPVSIDRLLSALTRLEKLKTHITQRPNLTAVPQQKTTHHKIDLHITTPQNTSAPITIHATHQSLPT